MKRHRHLLNRNEIIQGPSPAALRALRDFPADEANFYYDGYYGSALAPELSERFDIPEDRIIIGYGAESILGAFFDRLDPAKDAVLMNELHFDYYDLHLRARGVRINEFHIAEGEEEFRFDVNDCIAKIRRFRPKLILITSPNNPTGNILSARDLARILAAAPKTSIVAVDEAYYGFDGRYEEKAFLALLRRHGNLVFIRTFSKLYALAGLRIGYALCGKNIMAMIGHLGRRLGGSRVLEAVAVAAFRPASSRAYYRALAKEIAAERERAIKAVNRLANFKAFASRANLFAVKVAPDAKKFLEREMVRTSPLVSKFYAPTILRVSVGMRRHMDAFITMMEKADCAANAAKTRTAKANTHMIKEMVIASRKKRIQKRTTRAPKRPRTARYTA